MLQRTPQTGESNCSIRLRRLGISTGRNQPLRYTILCVGLIPGRALILDWMVPSTRSGARGGRVNRRPVEAGTIVKANKNEGLVVAAGDELLEILELQAPGKKNACIDYLNGHGITLPAVFH